VTQPIDPDAARFWHRERLVLLGLVFAGGALGTCVRVQFGERFGVPKNGWPWSTFFINISGAFALALLLGVLARLGDDAGWRRRTRLGIGTGILGGYTTYSTFAVEVMQRQGHAPLLGTGYAIATVVCGVSAAVAGLRLAAVRRRR
jgi:CrcB protein